MFLAHRQSFSSSRQQIPISEFPFSILCFGFILHWIKTALTWVLSLSLKNPAALWTDRENTCGNMWKWFDPIWLQYEEKQESQAKTCKWFYSQKTLRLFQSHPSFTHSFSMDWLGTALVRHIQLMLITSPANHCTAYGTHLVGISFAIIWVG